MIISNSFNFNTVCKSFGPLTFWVHYFALFSTDSNPASNFAFYSIIPISNFYKNIVLLILALFANFNPTLALVIVKEGLIPKADETVQKKKNIFYKCVLESHITSIVKIVVP